MTSYVVFLLGINVGGNRKVPMADLKALLEEHGYANVKTYLASGNVTLESEHKAEEIGRNIGQLIERKFGFFVETIVHKKSNLRKILASEPFKDLEASSDIKPQITFAKEGLPANFCIPDDAMEVMTVCKTGESYVCWALNLKKGGTADVMKVLTKALGKIITTRTWATLDKILAD